jgi:hypothetical protein
MMPPRRRSTRWRVDSATGHRSKANVHTSQMERPCARRHLAAKPHSSSSSSSRGVTRVTYRQPCAMRHRSKTSAHRSQMMWPCAMTGGGGARRHFHNKNGPRIVGSHPNPTQGTLLGAPVPSYFYTTI